MAFMFPIVMAVLNLSSVAAIWLGADRVADGELQIGALIALLSYLIQILMSVMMATFVAVLTPRASVSANRIGEVLHTESAVAQAVNPVTSRPSARCCASTTSSSATPAQSTRSCATSPSRSAPEPPWRSSAPRDRARPPSST